MEGHIYYVKHGAVLILNNVRDPETECTSYTYTKVYNLGIHDFQNTRIEDKVNNR